MSLQYHKINLSINGINILADSASLQEETNQKPLFAINCSGPIDYIPETIKSTLNIGYLLEINSGEPNYSIITGLKSNNLTGNSLAVINLAGVNITGYLNKFSYSVSPMQTIKAQASYEIFNLITGNFTQSNATDGNLYNLTNSSGLSNYFSAFLYSGNNQVLNSNILQLDYSFSCSIIPIYSLGNIFPNQVYISEGNESLSTISEIQTPNQFSGSNLISLFGVDKIKLKNISSTWGDLTQELVYNISGMKNNNSSVSLNTNNIILFNNSLSQSF